MQNLRDEERDVSVAFGSPPTGAHRTSPVEEDQERLEIAQNRVRVPVARRSVSSVRVRY